MKDPQLVLKEVFKIDKFRTSQEKIISKVLDGQNCLVLMPTGMGKSLCYQLPALVLEGLTVVLSPLIALMKDQVDKLLELGIDATFVNSSLGKNERETRYKNIEKGKYKIIFVSPERFRKDDFVEVIKTREISLLAIDEAHCASQWGNDFRPDYSKIGQFREILGNPTTIALTATATERVQKDIIAKLDLPENKIEVFNEGISRPNLHLSVIQVLDEQEKYDEMLRQIKENKGSKIIYFNLIKGLDAFSRYLDIKKIKHMTYHGKLSANERKRIQKKFINADSCLMLATNAFGMGIDKPDIRMIIHAEFPDSIESYYQEIGRAGRDGKPSSAILLYDEADLGVQMDFFEWKNPDHIFIKSTYNLLEKLGDTLQSHTYEDLQEQLVFKNRGDHRLQTVLNIFDRFNITTGSLELFNLKVVAPLPDSLVSEEIINAKRDSDKQRLYQMFQYVKTPECRRDFIHEYFGLDYDDCDNCDNC